MSCVYVAVLHGLLNVANIQKGQSILIHSAAGGVGIAAMHVCRYIGATIYATVGTSDKRAFLEKEFNIPSSHIFSSRSTDFAPHLMAVTNGRGVDVVLNSLTGEILDATWRCMADGGKFIEIGKKDAIDRKMLSMEPFNRGCLYSAVDMSHEPSTPDSLLQKSVPTYCPSLI